MKYLSLLLLLVGVSQSAYASEIECSSKFDRDGSKFIEEGKELNACIAHSKSPIYRKYDGNYDGKLSPEEFSRYQKEIDIEVFLVASDVVSEPGNELGVKITNPEKKEEKDNAFLEDSRFVLRSAYKPVSVLSTPTDDVAKVAGAGVSYTHDSLTGDHVINASGSAMYFRHFDLAPFKEGENQDLSSNYGLTGLTFFLGTDFNRNINTADEDKEVNSLILRSGGEVRIQQENLDHYFTAGLFDSTDFDFEAHVVGGSFEYRPLIEDIGMDAAIQLAKLPVFLQWQPVLHADLQHVVEDGDRASLVDKNSYLFGGPILSATLSFDYKLLRRLYFDTTYWYMHDFSGNDDTYTYGEVSANLDLDEEGHVALSARYRNGRLPIARTKVEDFFVGLTAKF